MFIANCDFQNNVESRCEDANDNACIPIGPTLLIYRLYMAYRALSIIVLSRPDSHMSIFEELSHLVLIFLGDMHRLLRLALVIF